VGADDPMALAVGEATLGYHPDDLGILTSRHNLVVGHGQVGSLTGAVASQRVTEAPKGSLRTVRNRSYRVHRHKGA
jgi:Family of unknown function (DUF6467)